MRTDENRHYDKYPNLYERYGKINDPMMGRPGAARQTATATLKLLGEAMELLPPWPRYEWHVTTVKRPKLGRVVSLATYRLRKARLLRLHRGKLGTNLT